jgi:hypothetical protein
VTHEEEIEPSKEPDEQFRFAVTPIERNTKQLIGVLAEYFPSGSNCGDLRLKFQEIAKRKHATFYTCLHFAKANQWIVTDGRIYSLNPNGSWRDCFKPYPNREELERQQLEHVLMERTERIEKLEVVNRRLTSSRKAIIAGEAAGAAIGALVVIMSDSTLPIRKRLEAAEGLLAYKTPQDVAESAKVFLTSIFTDPEQNIDYRLMAITALRRSEDARIMPPIERPSPVRTDTAEEPPIPLLELVRQRRERADRMQAEMIRQYGWRDNSSGGNRSDGTPDS